MVADKPYRTPYSFTVATYTCLPYAFTSSKYTHASLLMCTSHIIDATQWLRPTVTCERKYAWFRMLHQNAKCNNIYIRPHLRGVWLTWSISANLTHWLMRLRVSVYLTHNLTIFFAFQPSHFKLSVIVIQLGFLSVCPLLCCWATHITNDIYKFRKT